MLAAAAADSGFPSEWFSQSKKLRWAENVSSSALLGVEVAWPGESTAAAAFAPRVSNSEDQLFAAGRYSQL